MVLMLDMHHGVLGVVVLTSMRAVIALLSAFTIAAAAALKEAWLVLVKMLAKHSCTSTRVDWQTSAIAIMLAVDLSSLNLTMSADMSRVAMVSVMMMSVMSMVGMVSMMSMVLLVVSMDSMVRVLSIMVGMMGMVSMVTSMVRILSGMVVVVMVMVMMT